MSESKMLVRRILCLISAVFMLVISPASADASDLSGTWILSGIIYKNVNIPDTALADANEPEKEFSLVLEVEGDNDCRLILDKIAYSAQIDMISGDEYTVRIADNSCKLTCINEESALLHLSDDLTLILKKSDKKTDFSEAVKIEDLLIEEERQEALRKSIAEAEAAALAAIKPASVYDMHVSFSPEETQKMSAFMNYGRYCLENDTMIGMAYDKSGFLPNLVKCTIIKEVDTPTQEVFTVLDRHVNANFLTEAEDCLYYVRVDRESAMCSLARLNLKTEHVTLFGTEMHEMAYLQIHGNRLWYTGDEHRLFSCKLNGKDNRLELDKAVYEPYFLTDDWLIYQDDADGETFHIRCIQDGTDLKITDTRSFNPVVDGTVLYFTSIPDEGGKAYLSRADLSKPLTDGDLCFEIEKSDLPMSKPFWIVDSVIYGENNTSASVQKWKDLTNTAWLNITQRYFYIGNPYVVFGEIYPEHATVSRLYLADSNSGLKSLFRHVY